MIIYPFLIKLIFFHLQILNLESFSEKKYTYDSSSISTIDNSKRKFKKKRKYNEINKFPFPTENNNNFNNENEFLKKQCKYY